MKFFQQLWKLLASVQLAIFTLCAISISSIFGTVVPQGQQFAFYAQRYGDSLARFFQVLDLNDMYTSWWFISLLCILSANLIVCSFDRFPGAWKQMTTDPASFSPAKIETMPFNQELAYNQIIPGSALRDIMVSNGWSISSVQRDEATIIAGQKGRWSRIGVYVVHASILVIFAGALVGYFGGFKGSVMIPETKETSKIYASDTRAPIDLGFTVRCDLFTIEFYDNGMPKEYLSQLTVLEGGKEVLQKLIEVNSPLKYRGVTFYQSSYEGYRDFVLTLQDNETAVRRTFIVPFQQQETWDEQDLVFGIVNAEAVRDRVVRMKLWLKKGDNAPETFWLDTQQSTTISQGDSTITVSAKQMYATGLQVASDPGVWLVYLGCLLMMLGLYIAFFMSHRRVWVIVSSNGDRPLVLAGSANKNKIGFEKEFDNISSKISEAMQ